MTTEAHFKNTNPITDGLRPPTPFNQMEEMLSKEIARSKVTDDRRSNEMRRVYAESEEIK